MESMEDLRVQVRRYGDDICRLEKDVKYWRERAISAEAEAKERKCAMDFAERIGAVLTHNAGVTGAELAKRPR